LLIAGRGLDPVRRAAERFALIGILGKVHSALEDLEEHCLHLIELVSGEVQVELSGRYAFNLAGGLHQHEPRDDEILRSQDFETDSVRGRR
jgi:hypothetical protein